MKKHFLSFALTLFTYFLPLQASDQLELMQQEIKHIVIVMMENRSFDNMVAWLYEDQKPNQFIPDHTDPHYLGLTEENIDLYTNHLKNSNGDIIYSCPPIKGIPSTNFTSYINSPKYNPHEHFPHVINQMYNSSSECSMLGFLQDFASLWSENDWLDQKNEICAVMETYTDKELPVFHSLARHYAISDYWFSSVPTQTNPNRAFAFCGTSEGEVVNGPLAKNIFISDTIWNRISEKSPETSWAIFWQTDMLPGIFSGPYSGPNTFASLTNIPKIDDHLLKLDKFHELASKGELPEISFIEPQWTISVNLSLNEQQRFEKLFKAHDFILGWQGNDFHPPGDMRTGENFLANIYTSLISNPKAWEQTLLIITFDEHGGLFDHIIPPKSIAPDNRFQEGFSFDQYGVRIPTILISPKINKGVVVRSENDVPFDHTSLIAMLLKWTNVDPKDWNLGKRVDGAPTFEGIFARTEARKDSVLSDQEQNTSSEDPDVIKMGDRFCLKDNEGNYLCDEDWKFWHGFIPYLHKENLVLEFTGGVGDLMHGSFALIKSPDLEEYGENNILKCSVDDFYCYFSENTHTQKQWWTIKNVDHPFVGRKIRNGDKVYFENHVYSDITKYVPCRLTRKGSIYNSALRTEPVITEGCDQLYWTLEKISK